MTLTLHEVFRKIAAKSDKEFKVTVTYLEARELLLPSCSSNLQI